jgi:hypothetical protein
VSFYVIFPFSSMPTVFRYDSQCYAPQFHTATHPNQSNIPSPIPHITRARYPPSIIQHPPPQDPNHSTLLYTRHPKPLRTIPICPLVFLPDPILSSSDPGPKPKPAQPFLVPYHPSSSTPALNQDDGNGIGSTTRIWWFHLKTPIVDMTMV